MVYPLRRMGVMMDDIVPMGEIFREVLTGMDMKKRKHRPQNRVNKIN